MCLQNSFFKKMTLVSFISFGTFGSFWGIFPLENPQNSPSPQCSVLFKICAHSILQVQTWSVKVFQQFSKFHLLGQTDHCVPPPPIKIQQTLYFDCLKFVLHRWPNFKKGRQFISNYLQRSRKFFVRVIYNKNSDPCRLAFQFSLKIIYCLAAVSSRHIKE